MCFTICKRQVGVRSTALLNVMLTTERLNGDEAVGCGNYASSHIVSGPRLGGGYLAVGLFYHMQEKPSSPEKYVS